MHTVAANQISAPAQGRSEGLAQSIVTENPKNKEQLKNIQQNVPEAGAGKVRSVGHQEGAAAAARVMTGKEVSSQGTTWKTKTASG